MYLTNVSQTNMKLKKGTIIGEVEPVNECDLNPFPVSSTTPIANEEEVKKFKESRKVPILDSKRKKTNFAICQFLVKFENKRDYRIFCNVERGFKSRMQQKVIKWLIYY